jgi:hypothetical protein
MTPEHATAIPIVPDFRCRFSAPSRGNVTSATFWAERVRKVIPSRTTVGVHFEVTLFDFSLTIQIF